jgi:hypothetical protein
MGAGLPDVCRGARRLIPTVMLFTRSRKAKFKTKFKAREYVLLRLHQRETDEAMRGRSALTAANLLLRG